MFLLVSPLLDEVFEVLDVADFLDLLALHESGAVDGFAVGLLDQVESPILRNLDGAQKTELLRHLADNPNGARLVNDLGPQGTKSLFELSYRNADAVQLRSNLFQRYNRLTLGNSQRADFARLTADPKLQRSWVQSAGAPNLRPSNIKITLRQVSGLKGQVQRFKTADEVNVGYPPGTKDPYASGTIAIEYVTDSSQKFARHHGADNQVGSWMLRQEEITGLTPMQIQKKYSLPNTPEYVSDVVVPSGTSVRTGVIGKNFGGRRGATQFELREKISPDGFVNQRELPIN